MAVYLNGQSAWFLFLVLLSLFVNEDVFKLFFFFSICT